MTRSSSRVLGPRLRRLDAASFYDRRMYCTDYHLGPFGRCPNEQMHGWIHEVWLRCGCCGSDISPVEARRSILAAAREEDPSIELDPPPLPSPA